VKIVARNVFAAKYAGTHEWVESCRAFQHRSKLLELKKIEHGTYATLGWPV
jgi:hypothetical protein